MKVLIKFVQIVSICAYFSIILPAPVTRDAQDVFKNFICWQKCYSDQSFEEMCDHLNEYFLQRFNKHYLKHKNEIAYLNSFLNDLTAGYVSENGDVVGIEFNDDFRQNFSTLYQLIQNNMPRFMSYLSDHHFVSSNANNVEEHSNNVNVVINKYRALSKLFFANPNKNFENELLFSFANRCFEYCFSNSTWDDFRYYLDKPADYQLIRFLYSMIWFNLIGRGWKDWHNQTLDQVVQEAAHGRRVVYIAGGTDIYQLLKYGVYNIDVIDPFLPTQDRFYASLDWEWLVKKSSKRNGLGDKVIFNFGDRQIKMVRKEYKKMGYFTALLQNKKKQKIEKSITDWEVFDQDNKYLGVVTFHRRFCQQNDFVMAKNRLILMAINELYCAFLPKEDNGWGMKIKNLPKDFKVYVKQLRMPVDIDVLKHIRQAEDSKLKFIRLGSQII